MVELEYLLLFPSVSSLMTDLEDEHDIAEVRLRCAELTGRPLRELDLPDGSDHRPDPARRRRHLSRAHVELQLGDRLTIIGPVEAVRELARKCD